MTSKIKDMTQEQKAQNIKKRVDLLELRTRCFNEVVAELLEHRDFAIKMEDEEKAKNLDRRIRHLIIEMEYMQKDIGQLDDIKNHIIRGTPGY